MRCCERESDCGVATKCVSGSEDECGGGGAAVTLLTRLCKLIGERNVAILCFVLHNTPWVNDIHRHPMGKNAVTNGRN